MAVRQHLYSLHEERLVTYMVAPRPLGRPAKVWRLTSAAEQLFPDAHAQLCVSLVNALRNALGRKALECTLDVIVGSQAERYAARMPEGSSLFRRLKELARIRTEEGFVAQLTAADEASYHLIENHCPIRSAAVACPDFCAAEWETFQRLLGPETTIERLEHMQEGDRRCLYLIHHRSGEPVRRIQKQAKGH
jgi:predicted ArsR family transcriptional regulator